MVVGRDGRGVDEVVVTPSPQPQHRVIAYPKAGRDGSEESGILPRVLVVATGTSVEFRTAIR